MRFGKFYSERRSGRHGAAAEVHCKNDIWDAKAHGVKGFTYDITHSYVSQR